MKSAPKYLALWNAGRKGKMHLAQVKTTKQVVARAWCGRYYLVGQPQIRVSGEDAVFLLDADLDDHPPTCRRCLEKLRPWDTL